MIDYIPPDIPPAIIKYADEHYKKPDDATGRWFKYLTIWNNQELYATDWNYKETLTTGFPFIITYNCHDARRITKEEWSDAFFRITKYLSSYTKEEHLCHKDKRAFNQHTKPSDYKKKVKHVTPKYIPQAVTEYIDKQYEDKNYPGATKRIIKYLTTWQKNEVYFVYWTSSHPKRHSAIRPFLYDCKNVKRLDITEWDYIKSNFSNVYDVDARPHLCNKD